MADAESTEPPEGPTHPGAPANTGDQEPPRFSLRVGNLFVPLGWKLVGAIVVVVVVTVALSLLPEDAPSWISSVSNIIAGAVLGIVLQPTPLAPSNRTHAEFAVSSLADTTRSVASSRNAVKDLLASGELSQVVLGLNVVQSELDRTLAQLVNSVSEWDKIEPGITERVLKQINERAELARRLGVED